MLFVIRLIAILIIYSNGASAESQPSSSYSVHQEISDSSDLVSTKAQESDDIRISEENAIDTASNEVSLSLIILHTNVAITE